MASHGSRWLSIPLNFGQFCKRNIQLIPGFRWRNPCAKVRSWFSLPGASIDILYFSATEEIVSFSPKIYTWVCDDVCATFSKKWLSFLAPAVAGINVIANGKIACTTIFSQPKSLIWKGIWSLQRLFTECTPFKHSSMVESGVCGGQRIQVTHFPLSFRLDWLTLRVKRAMIVIHHSRGLNEGNCSSW